MITPLRYLNGAISLLHPFILFELLEIPARLLLVIGGSNSRA